MAWILLTPTRKGRIRRRHGLRPLRLMLSLLSFLPCIPIPATMLHMRGALS
jgi:hypothetical protein